MTKFKTIFKNKNLDEQIKYFLSLKILRKLFSKLSHRFKKEKHPTINEMKNYLELTKKEPCNANAHLKLAEIYEKKGEKQKANAEYFLVAEMFSKNGLYPHAMAIYKQILKQDQSLDLVNLKIANTSEKMGLLRDAFSQYSHLLHKYHGLGLKDQTQEIMALMDGLEQTKLQADERIYLKYRLMKEMMKLEQEGKKYFECPEKEEKEFFDLGAELEMSIPIEVKDVKNISTDKVNGFEEILKELKESSGLNNLYPNFNYDIGNACLEMGFLDEAIDQLQMAIDNGQNPFDAAKLLGTCFTKKGLWNECSENLKCGGHFRHNPARP